MRGAPQFGQTNINPFVMADTFFQTPNNTVTYNPLNGFICPGTATCTAANAVGQFVTIQPTGNAVVNLRTVGNTLPAAVAHPCGVVGTTFSGYSPVFSLMALVPWTYFASALAGCSTSLSGYQHIIYGVNVDDQGDFRPGQQAAKQHHVAAPLLTAKLTKQDVRELARQAGLRIWNKPASACLYM